MSLMMRNFLESLTLATEQKEKGSFFLVLPYGKRIWEKESVYFWSISIILFNQTLISKLLFRIPKTNMPTFQS